MSDACHQWLSEQLRRATPSASESKQLWLADENSLDSLNLMTGCGETLAIICNRYDIVQPLQAAGLNATFSDFDFEPIADDSLSAIYYRVSKEKPVVHHIINQAFRTLTPGGHLYITGQKNDGTKTYWDKARKLFGDDNPITKHGTCYSGSLAKSHNRDFAEKNHLWLDTQDYPSLRPIEETRTPAGQALTLISKPGLFGWNKIDQGSAFLAEHLPDFVASLQSPPERLLDLGCGYGYLTLMSNDLPLAQRTATDNNAAALLAARENFHINQMAVELVADDCGQSLEGPFDIVLCNPPFHQGFSVDARLTGKFLHQTRRLLTPAGAALFVVNRFIPLERKAGDFFGHVDVFAENRSFKLVRLAA